MHLLFFPMFARRSACYIAGSDMHSVLNDDEDCAMFVMFRERRFSLTLSYLLLVVLGCLVAVSDQCVDNSECKNGYCRAGMCICNRGWWGSLCQFCRLRWENVIPDGVHHERKLLSYVLLEITCHQKLLSLLICMLFLSTISLDHPDSYQVVPDIFLLYKWNFMLRVYIILS